MPGVVVVGGRAVTVTVTIAGVVVLVMGGSGIQRVVGVGMGSGVVVVVGGSWVTRVVIVTADGLEVEDVDGLGSSVTRVDTTTGVVLLLDEGSTVSRVAVLLLGGEVAGALLVSGDEGLSRP